MTKIKSIIDFEIIWKKLHIFLSGKEEKELDNWISEDKNHQKYFNNASRYYEEGSSYDLLPADPAEAFKKISPRLSERRTRHKIRTLAYVSSVAASILMLVGLFILVTREENAVILSETVQPIESGGNKARLITSDGSYYDLSDNKDVVIREEGSKIISDGQSIQYITEKDRDSRIYYNTIEVPKGGEFTLLLADGTKVWLNSGTTLRYPVSFSGSERVTELSGEAYFEVAKNEKMPFRVKSGDQVVEVMGTSFNISSYLEDSLITTTLVEGKVSVFLKENPEDKIILLPNYQSNLNRDLNTITRKSVDIQQYTAWKDGRFYFKDQPLSEIMKILSRWYDVNVIFENEMAKGLKFTGDLERYEDFEKILALIEKTEVVHFKITGRLVSVI